MARLTWDDAGKHIYETGVDRGVLYPMAANGETYAAGVAWNGLISVTESPSGGEANPIYADNIKYLNLYSAEEFGATIEAYTAPDEWAECDGQKQAVAGVTLSGQKRKTFGLCFRSRIGNDTQKDSYGYKLHLIYNATASPSERQYQTVNDSPEAITFSWEITTTPVEINDNFAPTSHIVIDSTKADSTKLTALEALLYGGDNTDASLPTPATVISTLT